jgi:hypothetical protein
MPFSYIAAAAPYLGAASAVNSLTGGAITNALGIGGGSVGGGGGSTTGQQAQAAADPFAQYRSQLGGMYAGSLQPGASSNIQNMPGYTQFNTGVMQPAMQASQRAAAGSGMLYSGNEQLALQKTGQQGYYGFMTDYMNRLAQGSGATNNPATAAGMGISQGNLNQQGVSQGLGALATSLGAIGKQFGGSYSAGDAASIAAANTAGMIPGSYADGQAQYGTSFGEGQY